MTLGPWSVGDTTTTQIVVNVKRDGVLVALDGYNAAEILLFGPDGAGLAWGAAPVLDTVADTVTLPPRGVAWTVAGPHELYLRLTTAGGGKESFHVATFLIYPVDSRTGWPPTLDELKLDIKIDLDDTRDDDRLAQVLDASDAFIRRVHKGRYQFDPLDPDQIDLTRPDRDMRLGVLRLAGRWHTRRRSPDAMIAMGDLGAQRVSSFDADIDRMCRIGRFAPMTFA